MTVMTTGTAGAVTEERRTREARGREARALRRRCPRCPATGGRVVEAIPGTRPGWISAEHAREASRRTGLRHHDHYDPELDAFLVVCDSAAGALTESRQQKGA